MGRATPRAIRLDGSLAFVPLSRGYEAIIDASDIPIVAGKNWHTQLSVNGRAYAVRTVKSGGTKRTIWLHREIIAATPIQMVDHIDGNGLNNRRANLRAATNSENLCNRPRQTNNTSGRKGVTWSRAAQKWIAQIQSKGQQQYLGLFEDIDAASAAYQAAATRLQGQFAYGGVPGNSAVKDAVSAWRRG